MPITALHNLGNTCYLNAALQLIMRCDGYVKGLSTKNDAFKDFADAYHTTPDNEAMQPNHILNLVRNRLTPRQQHDAEEFLVIFLEIFDKISKKFFDYRSYTYIENTEHQDEKKINKHNGRILSLTVEENIGKAYKNFCAKEEIDGWLSEHMNRKVRAIRTSAIYFWPSYLLVSFRRYNMDLKKIDADVMIPMVWTIHNKTSSEKKDSITYHVAGSILHIGGTSSGHYVAMIRDYPSGDFVLVDDSHKSSLKMATAKRMLMKSYIVLYERKEN